MFALYIVCHISFSLSLLIHWLIGSTRQFKMSSDYLGKYDGSLAQSKLYIIFKYSEINYIFSLLQCLSFTVFVISRCLCFSCYIGSLDKQGNSKCQMSILEIIMALWLNLKYCFFLKYSETNYRFALLQCLSFTVFAISPCLCLSCYIGSLTQQGNLNCQLSVYLGNYDGSLAQSQFFFNTVKQIIDLLFYSVYPLLCLPYFLVSVSLDTLVHWLNKAI